mmetsp:Transcript_36825/g.108585  ORF Transcript_36825/g.108585 Transcript_36825/m.108585 type:complete len:342 (-) Transcript_36825:1119-2144(-)|eukprot:359501-Chlamydomonas_euryale.AAC.8
MEAPLQQHGAAWPSDSHTLTVSGIAGTTRSTRSRMPAAPQRALSFGCYEKAAPKGNNAEEDSRLCFRTIVGKRSGAVQAPVSRGGMQPSPSYPFLQSKDHTSTFPRSGSEDAHYSGQLARQHFSQEHVASPGHSAPLKTIFECGNARQEKRLSLSESADCKAGGFLAAMQALQASQEVLRSLRAQRASRQNSAPGCDTADCNGSPAPGSPRRHAYRSRRSLTSQGIGHDVVNKMCGSASLHSNSMPDMLAGKVQPAKPASVSQEVLNKASTAIELPAFSLEANTCVAQPPATLLVSEPCAAAANPPFAVRDTGVSLQHENAASSQSPGKRLAGVVLLCFRA